MNLTLRNTIMHLFVLAVLSPAVYGQTLVHYWNFNVSTDEAALLAPTQSILAGASILHIPGGTSAIQATSNTGQGFEITNPNARNGDEALTHLRLNNPIGATLVFSLPTTGYQQIVVQYATRRSGSGAGTQKIEYTTDGINFDSLTVIAPVDGNPTLQTLDFSDVAASEDNPDFAVRITFEQGSGGLVGNNRFDNLSLDAFPLGADIFPPTLSFQPANGSVDLSVGVQPTLTFSEDIRLISDAPIANADIPLLVELRLDDAAGSLVAINNSFITGNIFTIVPDAPLANGQTYYLALKENVVEDLFDNAIATLQAISFTTISPQTEFMPGDIVPVAYRMNAAGAEDEVALLTLVNILPGTQIRMTDAKYTDNAQPQCPGGIVWTSPNQIIPARTVISIQNDAGIASQGTVTGSTFGLSSGGDQFIVYTGTAGSPEHITALSSNAWVVGPHTACGGSLSKLPPTLADGISSINLSTAPGNTAGNTVNGYYAGPQTGTIQELRAAILDPANWNGIGAGTPSQIWPSWSFPGPPQVVEATVLSSTTIQLVFNHGLDETSASDLAHYTGIADLASASPSSNGALADTVLLSYSTPFVVGNTYTLSVSNVVDDLGLGMVGTYEFTFTYITHIAFASRFISVSENGGTVSIEMQVENPSPGATVDLVLKGGVFSTASSGDITLTPVTTLDLSGSLSLIIDIPIVDDMEEEQDEYFVLALENAIGVVLEGNPFFTVYIRDNDRKAPEASREIELEFVSRYTVPNPSEEAGLAEIVAYDPASQHLFAISTGLKAFDIIDFSNPAMPAQIQQVDVSTYGGGITSIAVKNGLVAVCVPGINNEQENGAVVFFDADGVFQNTVSVGALPDMIVFSPDGNLVLTANEGQPNDAYTIDPEGSVSVIDISGGIAGLSQANVTTVDFSAFNSQVAALKAAGVRFLFEASSAAQDFEPEYVTISPDGLKAWVTLQENNAIAELDLVNLSFTGIWPLGTKDYNAFGNGLDLSDQSGQVHIANYPVKGFYLPDALANYSAGGTTYLVSANEGDEKEYAALNERSAVSAITLDPTAFPNAQVLQENHNMGRFRISNLQGDTDNDGDFDELYSVGARSFSIWNAQTGALVYDSGDDFEKITAENPYTAPIFNADNEGNGFKGRSRAKGPEPEGVALAQVKGRTYAFVTLERIGGVMVYDITDPNNVVFTDYKNSRSNTSYDGDNGPEGVIFIPASDSPDGNAYVVTANELSGTVAIFLVNTAPVVTFLDDVIRYEEGEGDVEIRVAVEKAGPAGTATLQVLDASTAVAGENYVLATTTIDIPAYTLDTFSVTLNLPENGNYSGGRYLVLGFENNEEVIGGDIHEQVIMIGDNDIEAPAAQSDPFIQLRHLGSYPGNPAGGSAEISAYDAGSKRLFVTNITQNTLDILDFSNPVAAVHLSSVDMTPYGGGINSVDVHDGIVAAAVQGQTTGDEGEVVFFDVNGVFINSVTVGHLPDMVVFNHAGTQAITANEGEPSSDYLIDPKGTISVIDLLPGVAAINDSDVATLTFDSFESQLNDLLAAGVRIFGPNASVAADLEPEYVCVSDDDLTALVTLQENNAIAVVDLVTLQITEIRALGGKDHSLTSNLLDASDKGGEIFFASWPIKGLYMPDAIECFEVGGVVYGISANEGDAREYDNLVEAQRLKDVDLDPTVFPDARFLQKEELLGRLNITTASGDTDGDGDYDEIYSFGARSITIWDMASGTPVWDSGSDFEVITANDPEWGGIFNASNGTSAVFKNRSDDKGPEPESVIVVEIEGRQFAFSGLERIGGIMVYEVSNPAQPEFIQYINTRDLGDLGPEGLIFIPKDESPNGRNLLVLSNEISGTLSTFQIDLDRTNNGELTLETFDNTPFIPIVDYQGQTIFEGGISGLYYIPGTDKEFYAVGDRGPNAAATNHPNATGTTLLFPEPDYAPKVTRFKAESGSWNIQSVEPLLRPGGATASGLPLPAGAGSTGEIAWADTIPTVLTPDIWGIDSEGIVEDNEGNFWFCDEYGASIWKVNKTTLEVLKRYTPFPTEAEDVALPAAIGKRRPNRGFEGVAYTPNGKIYAIIQSPADNPTVAVGNTGRLVRMVEIDPQTDEVRQFVYEMNPETGQIRTRDWKVGDLVAVNNNEFLLVEHAERNGWNVKNIYKIDISGATALTTEDFGGQTLEQVGNASGLAAFGVNVVQKEFVFDLLEAGWDLSHDKPEGLAIINDSTIAVVNDNDFGIDSPAGDGSVTFTGKTTRLYIFGLSNPLGYEFPLCSYTIPVSTQETCEGQAVVLDAGPGYAAYLWSDGSTSQTLETTDAGIYSVIVTNEAGCKASDETELIVWPLPTVNLGNDTLISTLETLVLDAGAGFDTYLWSDGSDGQTLEVLETGAYSVTVTDANGCIGTDEVIVTVINSVKDLAVGGQLNLFPNPSSGLVNLTFKEFIPGNYTLVLMDITGRPLLNREINIQSEMETQPVDLSSFPKGSYVLRIGSGQGTWIKKLILD